MSRSLLSVVLALAMLSAAFAKEKAADRDARVRAEIRQVLEKYLDARFRGADWKEVRDLVTWSEEQEEDGPDCTNVVRSYTVGDIRPKGPSKNSSQIALADVVFYQLGEYCAAEHTFKPGPHLDHAIFQLRRRSIVWAVEKTSRPGGQVDWTVIRDRLQQTLAAPFLLSDVRARATASLSLLEQTANAIGRTGPEGRRPEVQKEPEPEPEPAPSSPK